VFSVKDETPTLRTPLRLPGWNALEVQGTLDVRVESAEIQGTTDQVKTLYYNSLTLKSKSMSIEWVL